MTEDFLNKLLEKLAESKEYSDPCKDFLAQAIQATSEVRDVELQSELNNKKALITQWMTSVKSVAENLGLATSCLGLLKEFIDKALENPSDAQLSLLKNKFIGPTHVLAENTKNKALRQVGNTKEIVKKVEAGIEIDWGQVAEVINDNLEKIRTQTKDIFDAIEDAETNLKAILEKMKESESVAQTHPAADDSIGVVNHKVTSKPAEAKSPEGEAVSMDPSPAQFPKLSVQEIENLQAQKKEFEEAVGLAEKEKNEANMVLDNVNTALKSAEKLLQPQKDKIKNTKNPVLKKLHVNCFLDLESVVSEKSKDFDAATEAAKIAVAKLSDAKRNLSRVLDALEAHASFVSLPNPEKSASGKKADAAKREPGRLSINQATAVIAVSPRLASRSPQHRSGGAAAAPGLGCGSDSD